MLKHQLTITIFLFYLSLSAQITTRSFQESIRITTSLSASQIQSKLIDAASKENRKNDLISRIDSTHFIKVGDDINSIEIETQITLSADYYGTPLGFNPVTTLSFKKKITFADGEIQLNLYDFNQVFFQLYTPREDGSLDLTFTPDGKAVSDYTEVMLNRNSTLKDQLAAIKNVEKDKKGSFMTNEEFIRHEKILFKKLEAEYSQQLFHFPEKRWQDRVVPYLREEMKTLAGLVNGKIFEISENGNLRYKLEGDKILPVDEKEKKKWIKAGITF